MKCYAPISRNYTLFYQELRHYGPHPVARRFYKKYMHRAERHYARQKCLDVTRALDTYENFRLT
jgi:hypothetical protein